MGYNIFEDENTGKTTFSHVKRVAIVGAGVAGLQTARCLSAKGFECCIFEKAKDVGGVWRENYADFGLQVPKELYEFPGFQYPNDHDYDLFPTGPQVQNYIQRYAVEFNLMGMIKFGTPVVALTPLEGGGWHVSYEIEGTVHTEAFDFLVMSTGMYSSQPNLPKVRGMETFQGKILHSCTFLDKEQVRGKRVVVVGGGKSAVDNAVAAAKVGVSSTLLYRDAHWPVARYLLNLVPFKWGDAIPDTPIEIDLFTGGQILNYDYRDMLRNGQVKSMKGSINYFTEDGVVLVDGTMIQADVVIYGTGFRKSYDLFDKVTQEKLAVEKDGLYLFRNMIPPNVSDLAFIGSEVSTFNNVLTHGLQALWLQKMLMGGMQLPHKGEMLRIIEKEQAWKRSWMPPSSARASIWQLHMMTYHDNLCKDMQVKHMRKGGNIIAEILAPYSAADYKDLFKM